MAPPEFLLNDKSPIGRKPPLKVNNVT
jgi:hypothetical protein